MYTDRNLAQDYAKTFNLEGQRNGETGAQFRERIARTLEKMDKKVYAHEVLLNERMSGDPFAHGSLDRGYGDAFVTQLAEQTEATFQATKDKDID